MRFLPGLLLLLPLASPFAQAELIDDVNDRGELRIALEADLPPFSFQQDGQLTGFEVELGKLLAQELDVNASLLVTDASDLLSGVESGKYDVAINHMVKTPDLQDRFDFSQPYTATGAQMLVRNDLPKPPNTLQTFQNQTLGVVQNSAFVEQTPSAELAPALPLVIPFQKGNPAFQASLDNALQRIKADGRLAALSQKWLGSNAQQP